MKSDREILKIAEKVFDLELKIQKNHEDKSVKFYYSKIEEITKDLTLEEMIKIDEIIINKFNKINF